MRVSSWLCPPWEETRRDAAPADRRKKHIAVVRVALGSQEGRRQSLHASGHERPFSLTAELVVPLPGLTKPLVLREQEADRESIDNLVRRFGGQV